MPKTTILIVEDEDPIANYLKTILRTQDYKPIVTPLGKNGLSLAASHSPDIILLDLGLPDMDGVDFITALRGWTNIPVIVVSAREHERDQIEALDAGADDYLVKPFRAGELLARIRAALRSAARMSMDMAALEMERYICGSLTVDTANRLVRVEGEEVHLTPIEYRILLILMRNPGRVLTHSYIQSQVWGQVNLEQPANLRVFVSNLRRKIQSSDSDTPMIQTEIGVGYRFIDLA